MTPRALNRNRLSDGKPIDRQYYADHERKRVYLCSPECKEKFLKDPQKYLTQLYAEDIVVETLMP